MLYGRILQFGNFMPAVDQFGGLPLLLLALFWSGSHAFHYGWRHPADSAGKVATTSELMAAAVRAGGTLPFAFSGTAFMQQLRMPDEPRAYIIYLISRVET